MQHGSVLRENNCKVAFLIHSVRQGGICRRSILLFCLPPDCVLCPMELVEPHVD